ncbi:MAG: hypothetical protein WC175_04475 [Candidatus Dojkabacteria bacterium]
MAKWNHLSTLKTCLSEPSEVHAFGLGILSNIYCMINLPAKNKKEIEEEYPYFLAGKLLGLISLILLLWVVTL